MTDPALILSDTKKHGYDSMCNQSNSAKNINCFTVSCVDLISCVWYHTPLIPPLLLVVRISTADIGFR